MKNGWLFLFAIILACGSPGGPDTAGTGSKAGNAFRIKGAVCYTKSMGDTLNKGNVRITMYKIVPQAAGGYDWYPIKTDISDTSGTFTFDSLQAGNYSLVLEKDAYKAFSGYFAVTGQWNANVLMAGLPCALGATTVIFGKHIDKLKADAAKGIRTLPVILGEKNSRIGVMVLVALQYMLVVALVATSYFSWVMLLVLLGFYFSLPLWRMIAHPRPEEPPEEAKSFWPMWFVASAFYHYRAYGILFLAGLILQTVVR